MSHIQEIDGKSETHSPKIEAGAPNTEVSSQIYSDPMIHRQKY